MQYYEVQIQFYENSNSMWASIVDGENKPVYIFINEEEAENMMEKIQIENFPKLCRIVKKEYNENII
jgi:hypothetical protein